MRIITKYIYKEISGSIILGVIVFTLILILNSIFQIIELLVNKGASILSVTKLVFFLTITLLSITLPVSLLFAVLLTYGRFSEDNEIVAMQSAGIYSFSYIWQPLLLALLLSAFLCWSNLTFSPIVQKSFAKLYYSIAKESSSFNFQDNTFMRIGDFRIHIEQICKKNNVLKKVSIYKISSNSNQVMRIYASDGRVIFDSLRGIIFNLTNGVIQTFEKKFPESATHFRFGKYTLTVPFIENNIGFYSQTLREFTGRELLLEIKKYRENKLPTNYLEREYNLRWSIGTAAFFLVFTGLPLGVLFHRRGRSTGFGLSLLIISLYYFLLIGGITLADKGIVSSVLALWIPNIVIFSFGTLLFHRMVKK